MDRSFLSDPEIVAASRAFVCARLLTYESASEGEFLESIFHGASGRLENTVFTFLAPDGKTRLTRSGRAPDHVFPGPTAEAVKAMAAKMKELSTEHPGVKVPRDLPLHADLRRALVAASCDLMLVVAVVGRDGEARRPLREALAGVAWHPDYAGRFAYAEAAAADLAKIEKAPGGDRVLVIEPDAFGVKGRVLAESKSASPEDLRAAMDAALKTFAPAAKDSHRHIQEARRQGIRWETEIPVTDPGPPGR